MVQLSTAVYVLGGLWGKRRPLLDLLESPREDTSTMLASRRLTKVANRSSFENEPDLAFATDVALACPGFAATRW